MKSILLINFFLFGVIFPSAAQFSYPVLSDSVYTANRLELDGGVDLHGTSLKRELFGTLIWGGAISDEMKDRSFAKHSDVNRFGITANNELRYFHGKGRVLRRDSISWGVKAGYFAVGNLTYGTDVFGLVFYGNEEYLSNTATFSNTRLNFTQFQKVGFGLFDKYTGSSLFLNLVNVQNYADLNIRKGELTQNEDGSQVDLDLRGDFSQTVGSSFSKGIGLALDIDYRLEVPWMKDGKTWFQISAQNLGLAYMHTGVTNYSVDSNYTYTGFQLNQLTNGSSVFGDDFSILDSMGIQKITKHPWIKLPGYVQAMKLIDPNASQKMQSFFGVRLYPTLNSVPSVFAGAYWKVISPVALSGALAYGGFGGFRTGVYLTYTAKSVNLVIGSEDVVGLVSASGLGQSFLTRLTWKLK